MNRVSHEQIMQQKQKQLLAQKDIIYSHNKLNYHLKKTEPFRNKPKKTVADQMRAYHRNEKVSTIQNNHNLKRYINKPIKKQEEPESQNINEEHANENIANVMSQVKIYQTPGTVRKNIFHRDNSQSRFKKIDIVQRGKSLKYWKVQKSEPKFLTHLKGFFNTFLSEDDGCKCGPNCQCKQVLIKWINVSDELLRRNYERLLSIAYKNQYDKSEKSSRYGATQFSNYGSSQYSDYEESVQQKLQRSKHQIQIQKDIIRTQTQYELFHRKDIQDKMQRILMCYTVEDPEVGYVQSMNIVISGVLYHIRDEAKTYAICRKLFHQIRRIYLKDFKQCYEHVDQILKLFQIHIYDLYHHLQEIGVQLKVILFPWILSLLCVVVPLQYLHFIYMGFVREGWKFIYKTILAVFVYHKEKLKSLNQNGDILVFLSASNQAGRNGIDWEDIIKFAKLKIII